MTFCIRRDMSYLERDLSLAVGGHQLGVHALRSAARRQPQDEVAKGDKVGVKTDWLWVYPFYPLCFTYLVALGLYSLIRLMTYLAAQSLTPSSFAMIMSLILNPK